MLFSQSDVDILRLIRWCQFLLPEDLTRISNEVEIGNLLTLGLIRQHKKSGAFIMSKKGVALLQVLFSDIPPKYPPSYHTAIIRRRLRLSRLALTAYSGGVDIFLSRNEALSNTPSIFFSTLTRERGSNPWGSTRVAAIAHLGDLFCAVHYVSPGIGKLSLTDELTAFSNQTAREQGLKQIAVAALERQAKTVLIPRYQETGQARVFALTGEAVSQVTGRPPVPYTPPRTQFLTEKGDVVDAPPIRVPGKAGGQAGRKMRPLG